MKSEKVYFLKNKSFSKRPTSSSTHQANSIIQSMFISVLFILEKGKITPQPALKIKDPGELPQGENITPKIILRTPREERK